MKTRSGYLALAGAIALSACQQGGESQQSAAASAEPAAATEPTLNSERERLSYALGLSLGKQMHADEMDVDLATFGSGFGHGMGQGDALLSDEEMTQQLQAFQQQRRQEQQQKFEAAAEKNRSEGEAWLAENAKKEGVVTTESGLQYKILTAGTGEQPSAEDTVSVHYRGTLLDGTEFDSSYSRGQPAEFPVNRVIGGWTEALQLMPTGSKWELYIPSDLAYGQAGTGREIGPNATLMFEVELLEIKKQ